jgi:putative ubiquitin-RnfH superfamily antitoxin RatB of RatAB toxin-antitoxin module
MEDRMPDSLTVEVAYATNDRQEVLTLKLPAGVSAHEAVLRSGLCGRFPEIDLAKNRIGVFGKLVKPDTVLRDRDRVEIYRPLIADPKDVRKQRAAEGKVMKKGAA